MKANQGKIIFLANPGELGTKEIPLRLKSLLRDSSGGFYVKKNQVYLLFSQLYEIKRHVPKEVT